MVKKTGRKATLAKALLRNLPEATSRKILTFLSKEELEKIQRAPFDESPGTLFRALYEAGNMLLTLNWIEITLATAGTMSGIALYLAGRISGAFSGFAWGAGQCILLPILLMLNLPGGWHLWGIKSRKIWIYGITGGTLMLPMFLLVRAYVGGTGEASWLWLKILTGGVFATLAEEVLFRRLIYGELTTLLSTSGNPRAASLVSALVASFIFMLVHMGNGTSILYLTVVFISSMILCFLYEKTASIITPWIAHSIVNIVNFLAFP